MSYNTNAFSKIISKLCFNHNFYMRDQQFKTMSQGKKHGFAYGNFCRANCIHDLGKGFFWNLTNHPMRVILLIQGFCLKIFSREYSCFTWNEIESFCLSTKLIFFVSVLPTASKMMIVWPNMFSEAGAVVLSLMKFWFFEYKQNTEKI